MAGSILVRDAWGFLDMRLGPEVQFRFHGIVGQEMLSRVFTGSALIRSDVIRLARRPL